MTLAEMDEVVGSFDGRLPGAADHRRLCTLVVEHPLVAALQGHQDPFSDSYRTAAVDLYALLRGTGDDRSYRPERDERSATGGVVPERFWTELTPWSFQDPALVAEFLFSWGRILQLLKVKPGDSVVEYGPGSGQVLLMLARLGVQAFGVDIDAASVRAIRLQADALALTVRVEQGLFGEGFGARAFNGVLFYEAFHHSLDFMDLLARLQQRLLPGGRVVLCGEPVVAAPSPEIPFPWGPRLDGLSVFSMRRWGWMELGFTRDFLFEAARRAGWVASHHPSGTCPRADAVVLERQGEGVPAPAPDPLPPVLAPPRPDGDDAIRELTSRLLAMERSTSWKVTAPLRALKRLAGMAKPGGRAG